ncbi:hypothetical protein [Longispora urticae]
MEIYRTDPVNGRRATAVELLRVLATGDDMPLVTEFLTDPDPGVQLWGIGVLDQLLFWERVEPDDAEPYLHAAERHANPKVRERCAFIRGVLQSRQSQNGDHSTDQPAAGSADADSG